MGGSHLGRHANVEDSAEMPGFDDLRIAPEIVVDLESEIVDTSVDPTSADTDVSTTSDSSAGGGHGCRGDLLASAGDPLRAATAGFHGG